MTRLIRTLAYDLDVPPPTQGQWTAAFLLAGMVFVFVCVALVTGQ
jgi:hypothetical protein